MGCCNSGKFDTLDLEVSLVYDPPRKSPEKAKEKFSDISLGSHSDSSDSPVQDSQPVFLMNSALALPAIPFTKERSFTVTGARHELPPHVKFTGVKVNPRSISYSAGQSGPIPILFSEKPLRSADRSTKVSGVPSLQE